MAKRKNSSALFWPSNSYSAVASKLFCYAMQYLHVCCAYCLQYRLVCIYPSSTPLSFSPPPPPLSLPPFPSFPPPFMLYSSVIPHFKGIFMARACSSILSGMVRLAWSPGSLIFFNLCIEKDWGAWGQTMVR